MLPRQLFLQENAAPDRREYTVGRDDGRRHHNMIFVRQSVDVEKLADRFAGSADVLWQLQLEGELFAADQQIGKAAQAGGQEGQLVGDVRGVLVERFQHQRVGEGAGGIQQTVGDRQADGQPAFGVLAVGVLLTARAQLVVLPRLDDAEADHAGADHGDRADDQHGICTIQCGQAARQQAQYGDQRAGGVADGGRDRKLNIAQADIAQRHGNDVQQ